LPIDLSKVGKIAILGDDAHDSPQVAGDGSGHVNNDYVVTSLDGIKARIGEANVEVTYANTTQVDLAVHLAQEADIAIVFIKETSSEGSDRESLTLPNGQDDFVAKIAAAQPNVVVVLHVPGAVLMPWEKQVKGILCGFMPGQEVGNAVAKVLFGDFNPYARLPITFPMH